jgi:hypothetical protein
MDYLGVVPAKIGRLRVEIAGIQELNQQFRRDGRSGTGVQVAHGQRSERLQQIQHELVQLARAWPQCRFDRANERTAAYDTSRQAETSSVASSVPGSSKTKSVPDSSSHWTLSERPSPKGLLTGTLLSDLRGKWLVRAGVGALLDYRRHSQRDSGSRSGKTSLRA